jgi:hypothetical protein
LLTLDFHPERNAFTSESVFLSSFARKLIQNFELDSVFTISVTIEYAPQTCIPMAKPTEKQKIEDVFPEICARVASGELLTDICESFGFTRSWFYLWLSADAARVDAYARAREQQQHAWADDIVKLADVCRVGNKVTEKGDGTVETVTADRVERTRLQIESRKWLMARLNPRAYGDKQAVELSGKDGGPIQTTQIVVHRGKAPKAS